jgi:hypothetical protein
VVEICTILLFTSICYNGDGSRSKAQFLFRLPCDRDHFTNIFVSTFRILTRPQYQSIAALWNIRDLAFSHCRMSQKSGNNEPDSSYLKTFAPPSDVAPIKHEGWKLLNLDCSRNLWNSFATRRACKSVRLESWLPVAVHLPLNDLSDHTLRTIE